MNASVFRNTRFELRSIEQGPNSFRVICSPRDVLPDVIVDQGREVLRAKRTPPLDVPEEDFTEQEMALVHTVFELLETKFAAVFDRWAADPERNAELVVEAVEAERRLKAARTEAARIEAENAVKRQEAAELERNLAAMREAAAAEGPGPRSGDDDTVG